MLSGDRPERKRLDHVPPSWSPEDAVYFITICAQPKGADILCRPVVAHSLLESIAFYYDQRKWYCQMALLMPDHLHGFFVFPWDKSMASVFQNWKRYTAKSLGINWQRDFFEHRIRNEGRYTETWHYVRQNPVRAGLVDDPNDWLHRWEPEHSQ